MHQHPRHPNPRTWQRLGLPACLATVLLMGAGTRADTYRQGFDGNNHYANYEAAPGSHTFIVDGFDTCMYVEWYADGIYMETDSTCLFNDYQAALFTHSLTSGCVYVEANVYDQNWNWISYIGWQLCAAAPETPCLTIFDVSVPAGAVHAGDVVTVAIDLDCCSSSQCPCDLYLTLW